MDWLARATGLGAPRLLACRGKGSLRMMGLPSVADDAMRAPQLPLLREDIECPAGQHDEVASDHTPNGKVSGGSPPSHCEVGSSGLTARVSSVCTMTSNWSANLAQK